MIRSALGGRIPRVGSASKKQVTVNLSFSQSRNRLLASTLSSTMTIWEAGSTFDMEGCVLELLAKTGYMPGLSTQHLTGDGKEAGDIILKNPRVEGLEHERVETE